MKRGIRTISTNVNRELDARLTKDLLSKEDKATRGANRLVLLAIASITVGTLILSYLELI